MSLKTIPIDKIRVPTIRVSSVLNEEQKALMAATIREVGVIQDPVVRDLGDGTYELVAGKSRIEELAAQGLTEIQVKVIPADEKTSLIMNIIENISRGSFEYISVAQAIRKLRTMGTSYEELEKIFPWSKRWIEFIEGLQDLPDDVTAAIAAKKLTPTHVQVAAHLPTAYEVHDGLKTAVRLGWDSGTLKVFVENRLEQISRARQVAVETGGVVEIPPPDPEQLIKYKQCLLCGYRKPAETITLQLVCEPCQKLVGYICSQEGPPEKAMDVVYNALCAYYGRMPQISEHPAAAKEADAPK